MCVVSYTITSISTMNANEDTSRKRLIFDVKL